MKKKEKTEEKKETKNKKNRIIKIIGISTLLMIILLAIIGIYRKVSQENHDKNLKNILYCGIDDYFDICYEVKKDKLIEYQYDYYMSIYYYDDLHPDKTENEEDEDETDIYRFNNVGPAELENYKILEHTDDKLLIQVEKDGRKIIKHYYKVAKLAEKKVGRENKLEEIYGKSYKKGDRELFFLDGNSYLVADEKGEEKDYYYYTISYDDEYHDVYLYGSYEETNGLKVRYTYNDKTNEIYGLTSVEKEDLEKINTSYYDENGKMIPNNSYYITRGIYRYTNYQEGTDKILEQKEVYINKDKITWIEKDFKNQPVTTTAGSEKIKIGIINEEEVNEYGAGINLTLDRKTGEYKSIKTATETFEKINKEECEMLDMDAFKEDGTISTTINLDGAYITDSEDEFYMKENTIMIYNDESKEIKKLQFYPVVKSKTAIYYKSKEDPDIEIEYDLSSKTLKVNKETLKKVDLSELKHM